MIRAKTAKIATASKMLTAKGVNRGLTLLAVQGIIRRFPLF
ncbi:DUF2575 domain-containing protein [Brenneria rubrifaciens]|uniref:DUF2575 domain-containing protein n=1 Tax=Brenneria rubrifaciens TaxID=55213 RepID=A0A4P8QZ87_9GAMM|nr:DUF2575 domain-containing protein [Brenneria rubrifaciens]